MLEKARHGLYAKSLVADITPQQLAPVLCRETARKENVRVKRNGKTCTVNLAVVPLKKLRERCFLILFEEAEKASGGNETPEPQRTRADRSPSSEKRRRIAELETHLG